jgi:hypothetical protein
MHEGTGEGSKTPCAAPDSFFEEPRSREEAALFAPALRNKLLVLCASAAEAIVNIEIRIKENFASLATAPPLDNVVFLYKHYFLLFIIRGNYIIILQILEGNSS